MLILPLIVVNNEPPKKDEFRTDSNIQIKLRWLASTKSFSESLSCPANQWTGFYMITPPVMKELKVSTPWMRLSTKVLPQAQKQIFVSAIWKKVKCKILWESEKKEKQKKARSNKTNNHVSNRFYIT